LTVIKKEIRQNVYSSTMERGGRQMPTDATRMAGPAIHATDPWTPGNPKTRVRHQLLSEGERAQLAKIAAIVRFEKGERIYNQGDRADAVFNIISGVVTAYRMLAEGPPVMSFLYPGDLFGLSEEARYTNTARATTPVIAYKMPLQSVQRILSSSANLDVQIIVKLCDELRQAQHHAVLLSQKRAAKRLAMFLELQEHLQIARNEPISEIYLPMDRSSIADYLGITLPALSRAFRALVVKKIIATRGRNYVKVLDREAFKTMADA
jgi:CRP-like cAMP-binding protein